MPNDPEQSSASSDELTGSADAQGGVDAQIIRITEDGAIRIFENTNVELVDL
jgi:hypothetical protein